MIKCPVCGASINDTDETCKYCGADVAKERKALEAKKEKKASEINPYFHYLDEETLLNAAKATYYGINGVVKDVAKAMNICEELANRGNVEGIYLLGVMKCETGDKATAYKLWRFAAKRNHEPSKLKLAVEFGNDKASQTVYRDVDEEIEEEMDDEAGVIDSVVMIICGNSCGTGFIAGDGLVVTNAHVVDGYKQAVCFFKDDMSKEGTPNRVHVLNLIAFHKEYDIAVLRFEEREEQIEFEDRSLPLALRADYEEKVKTIGYPLGLPFSVSKGIISNPRQHLNDHSEYRYKVSELIQTDISINSGNSGGPLINTSGGVVGVISCRPTDAAGGIGFAVPASYVDRILKNIK